MQRILDRIKSSVSVSISVVFLYSTIVSPVAEANFWQERRKAVQQTQSAQTPFEQFAQVPSGLADINNALPRVTNGIPGLQKIESIDESKIEKSATSEVRRLPKWLSSLPSSYGEIQKIQLVPQADKRPLVVLVQDAHEIYSAQVNIAHMLNHLQTSADESGQGNLLIALEGSAGAYDFAPYRKCDVLEHRKVASDFLLSHKLLSGPEVFGITAKNLPTFWGVETPNLYIENVDAYRASLPKAEDFKNAVYNLEFAMKPIKDKFYNLELWALDENLASYYKGDLDLLHYVRFLSGQAGDLSKFPEIKKLLDVLSIEESLDFKVVESERTQLIQVLSQKLDKAALNDLLQYSLAYRAGQISYGRYYDYLRTMSESHGVHLEKFQSFSSYIQYVLKAEAIEKYGLFEEVESLKDAVIAKLGKTREQKELLRISEDIKLLSRLQDFQFGPAEWKNYQAHRSEILELSSRITAFGAKLSIDADLKKLLPLFERFYIAADKRNNAMVSNLLKKSQETKSSAMVLVAGGFHTPVLESLLKSKDISVVTLTPKVGPIDKNTHALDLFAMQHIPLEKLLLGEKLFMRLQDSTVAAAMATAQRPDGLTTFQAIDATEHGATSARVAGTDEIVHLANGVPTVTRSPRSGAARVGNWVSTHSESIRNGVLGLAIVLLSASALRLYALAVVQLPISPVLSVLVIPVAVIAAVILAISLNQPVRERALAYVRNNVYGFNPFVAIPLAILGAAMSPLVALITFAASIGVLGMVLTTGTNGVPGEEEVSPVVQRGLDYREGRLKTSPVRENFRPSRQTDVPSIPDMTVEQRKPYVAIAVDSLRNGEGNKRGIFSVLAAGASSRMNTKEAKESAPDAYAMIQEMYNDPNHEIKSKAAVPIGKFNGVVFTFLGLLMTNVSRVHAFVSQSAGHTTPAPRVLILTNDDYRPELDAELALKSNYGVGDDVTRFHQELGEQYVATVADTEAYYKKQIAAANDDAAKAKTEELRQAALKKASNLEAKRPLAVAAAQEAQDKIAAGNKGAVILANEKTPLGHGEFFHQIMSSGLFLEIMDAPWIYARNIDNSAAKFDEDWMVMLGMFLSDDVDFQPEVSPRAPRQKGGALVIGEDGRHILTEDPSFDATWNAYVSEMEGKNYTRLSSDEAMAAAKEKLATDGKLGLATYRMDFEGTTITKEEELSDQINAFRAPDGSIVFVARVTSESSAWFNNAAAFFRGKYLYFLYRSNPDQTYEQFVEEYRNAKAQGPVALEAIANRGRLKFPTLIDPKPSRGSDAVAVKIETNMWQSTQVAEGAKIRAVGVHSFKNIDVAGLPQLLGEVLVRVLSALRFLGTKQWIGPAESYEYNKPILNFLLPYILGGKLVRDEVMPSGAEQAPSQAKAPKTQDLKTKQFDYGSVKQDVDLSFDASDIDLPRIQALLQAHFARPNDNYHLREAINTLLPIYVGNPNGSNANVQKAFESMDTALKFLNGFAGRSAEQLAQALMRYVHENPGVWAALKQQEDFTIVQAVLDKAEATHTLSPVEQRMLARVYIGILFGVVTVESEPVAPEAAAPAAVPETSTIDQLIEKLVNAPVTTSDVPKDIFRDYDFRTEKTVDPSDDEGLLEAAVKPEVAFRLAFTWARMAIDRAKANDNPNRTVVVARDGRKVSPELLEAVIAGLRYAGLNVIDATEDGPNCASSYSTAVNVYKPLMSIFLTASHVSRAENVQVRGFKVAIQNARRELQSLTTREIKNDTKNNLMEIVENPGRMTTRKSPYVGLRTQARVNEVTIRMAALIGRVAALADAGEHISLYDLEQEIFAPGADTMAVLTKWESRLGADNLPLQNVKVVVEAAHTISGSLAAETMTRLGAQVTLLNGDVQEISGPHAADPSIPKNMVGLKDAIKEQGADFGLAFDLDGDRGQIVVRTESGELMDLRQDNLMAALIPFLMGQGGYDPKTIGKKVAFVRDVLGSRVVNEVAERNGAEVFQADAGYPFLKAIVRRLTGENYVVPIYAEASGHGWLSVTGTMENPIAIAVLYAVMAVQHGKVNNVAAPFEKVYYANTVPYRQSTRFQPAFSEPLKMYLSALSMKSPNPDLRWVYSPSAKPPPFIIAMGKDYVIKEMQKVFVPGTGIVFNSPAGLLKVKAFNTYQDQPEDGGLYRFADIEFELNGQPAGRFVFRASSNDPSFVTSFETPLSVGETADSDSASLRYISILGVVMSWVESNEYGKLIPAQLSDKDQALLNGPLNPMNVDNYPVVGYGPAYFSPMVVAEVRLLLENEKDIHTFAKTVAQNLGKKLQTQSHTPNGISIKFTDNTTVGFTINDGTLIVQPDKSSLANSDKVTKTIHRTLMQFVRTRTIEGNQSFTNKLTVATRVGGVGVVAAALISFLAGVPLLTVLIVGGAIVGLGAVVRLGISVSRTSLDSNIYRLNTDWLIPPVEPQLKDLGDALVDRTAKILQENSDNLEAAKPQVRWLFTGGAVQSALLSTALQDETLIAKFTGLAQAILEFFGFSTVNPDTITQAGHAIATELAKASEVSVYDEDAMPALNTTVSIANGLANQVMKDADSLGMYTRQLQSMIARSEHVVVSVSNDKDAEFVTRGLTAEESSKVVIIRVGLVNGLVPVGDVWTFGEKALSGKGAKTLELSAIMTAYGLPNLNLDGLDASVRENLLIVYIAISQAFVIKTSAEIWKGIQNGIDAARRTLEAA